MKSGFTLIELSIVLVIIGLIVGGILTGRDLINSAAIRAQITQIERYNAAVRTFQNKYGGLPGDLVTNLASQFGFQVANCGINQPGNRDGNGFINGGYGSDDPDQEGENLLFWYDLSSANLIDQTIPNSGGGIAYSPCSQGYILSLTPGTAYVGDIFPTAKIGNGNFIYVYDRQANSGVINGSSTPLTGDNWYGISAITASAVNGGITSNPGVTVLQAYNIDKKIDDGSPSAGHVRPVYNTGYEIYAANPQASDSSTSCYNTTTNAYSMGINGGNGVNCAVSFQFQ